MTVKHSLLAILTLGSAYGLQLRDELVERAPHREGINVGQVYGTLERLRRAGLIAEAALTSDNLQLYTLTDLGRRAASEWMTYPAQTRSFDWTEMLDQVLVVSSIPGGPLEKLVSHYQTVLEPSAPAQDDMHAQQGAFEAATASLHDAATRWLDQTSAALHRPSSAYELSQSRPRRGRRATV